jgi:putative hemolysin
MHPAAARHTTMALAQHTSATPPGETVARQASAYTARLARDAAEVRAAQALRFEVFNLELDEGLVHSYDTGLDVDPFDAVCDHLIVEDRASGALVGTYRLQTGLRARDALGYYSEREFDFTPFEAQRPQMLELGRACIHQRHRNFAVLNLLWKGIGRYARDHGARYLVGCSSLTSQDAATGLQAYRQMQGKLTPPAWRTQPQAAFVCTSPPGLEASMATAETVHLPRLLSAYLALGAGICGPPAIDREFRTIDFLTWLDVDSPTMQAIQKRGRFTA